MARTAGIDFKITGDSKGAQAAFSQLSRALQKSGADVEKVAKQFETAQKRQADAAAKVQAGALLRRSNLSAGNLLGNAASNQLGNAANALGLGGAVDELGGIESLLTGVSTKAVVATAGVAALGAATLKFAQVSAQAYLNTTQQVDDVADALGGSAEEADKVVGVFRGLGINADQGASAMAKLAKNVTTNQAELQKYGVAISRNAEGGVDFYQTLLNVAAAYQAQSDPALKAQVATAAFGKEWASMVDLLETSRPKLEGFAETLAPDISDSDLESLKAFKATVGEFKSQYEDLKVTAGRPIVFFAGATLDKFNTSIKGVTSLLHGDFEGAMDIAQGKGENVGFSFTSAALGVAKIGQAAAIAGPQIMEVAKASEIAAAAAAQFAAVTDTPVTRVNAQIRLRSAIGALAQTQQQASQQAGRYADAQAAVGKAASEGAKAIASAQADGAKAIADAQESGAKAVADAQESQAKTVESGARRVAEAERRAAEVVENAQEKIIDARKRAADQAQDDADRVEDARRALVDAKTSAAGEDNPFEATRRIEDAQLALARAERDRSQNQQDDAKDVADAEQEASDKAIEAQRDLSDARRDAAEADAEAAQRLADAQTEAAERVAEAQAQAAERIAAAQEQSAERVASAQDAAMSATDNTTTSIGNQAGKLDDLVGATFDAAFQTREMGGSQDDIKKKVDDSKAALDLYRDSLGLTNEQVAYYKQLLDLIPLTVRTKIQFSFENITANAADLASNAIARAAAKVIADNMSIPQFAGGGLFRAQGGGAGLAVLHDGERVLTPEQQVGVGTTINVHVHGSVTSDRDLLATIDRAYRRGFRGGPQ